MTLLTATSAFGLGRSQKCSFYPHNQRDSEGRLCNFCHNSTTICRSAFIRHTSIPKRIAILQFRF